jgi:hypothetical protein
VTGEQFIEAAREQDTFAMERAIAAAIRAAVEAERERCAVEAELTAENYRESGILHGETEPMACYRSRCSAARAVARRIREGTE